MVQQCRVFVSRIDPDLPVDSLIEFVRELTGETCNIVKLETKYPTYASYVITCDQKHERVLTDPNEWEEGIVIL